MLIFYYKNLINIIFNHTYINYTYKISLIYIYIYILQILRMMYKGFQSVFRGGDQPWIPSLWVFKWNYGPSMLKWGIGICQIGCTKFNEGCTKFCEGCTNGPKMRTEVGIGPKSICFAFLNEIVAHPRSEEGPGITRIGCTKFSEGCTKGLKVHFEVGIGPKSLPYGFLT